MQDVVVCGGGAAGLSAALWLGRYRRKTLVLDTGESRNLASHAVHGYYSQDHVSPRELLDLARADITAYPTVAIRSEQAIAVSTERDRFVISARDAAIETRKIILATGVEDLRPDIPGFSHFYGRSIFHCSCCDGYEARDQDVVAIGWGEHTAGFALDLLDWGARVVLVTNGEPWEGDRSCEEALQRHGIEVIEERVEELMGVESLSGARLSSGRVVPAEKAFFSIGHEPRNQLAKQLGCRIDGSGYVEVGAHGETSVEGVYAAGDLTPGEQLVQVAAAEGAVAGIACAMSLRGSAGAPGAPEPGPDPEEELTD
jgi:thioredoxin reductase